MYDPGVGSGGTKLDQYTGGMFGMGLDQVQCLLRTSLPLDSGEVANGV
jgi:hypothetical protein